MLTREKNILEKFVCETIEFSKKKLVHSKEMPKMIFKKGKIDVSCFQEGEK